MVIKKLKSEIKATNEDESKSPKTINLPLTEAHPLTKNGFACTNFDDSNTAGKKDVLDLELFDHLSRYCNYCER